MNARNDTINVFDSFAKTIYIVVYVTSTSNVHSTSKRYRNICTVRIYKHNKYEDAGGKKRVTMSFVIKYECILFMRLVKIVEKRRHPQLQTD